MLTGDGANLSQGQRQLLAIARAAVADPPVLILDEATSSIDTRTESLVQEGMDRLMKGRTTFVIAHRLSTVKNADCIMVLEQGRIIERGTHDQLIAEKGRYYQLYTGNAIGEGQQKGRETPRVSRPLAVLHTVHLVISHSGASTPSTLPIHRVDSSTSRLG